MKIVGIKKIIIILKIQLIQNTKKEILTKKIQKIIYFKDITAIEMSGEDESLLKINPNEDESL